MTMKKTNAKIARTAAAVLLTLVAVGGADRSGRRRRRLGAGRKAVLPGAAEEARQGPRLGLARNDRAGSDRRRLGRRPSLDRDPGNHPQGRQGRADRRRPHPDRLDHQDLHRDRDHAAGCRRPAEAERHDRPLVPLGPGREPDHRPRARRHEQRDQHLHRRPGDPRTLLRGAADDLEADRTDRERRPRCRPNSRPAKGSSTRTPTS